MSNAGTLTSSIPTLKKRKATDGFIPQQCEDFETCGITVEYGTQSALTAHRERYHSNWPSTQCGVDICKNNMEEYSSRSDYAQHLRVIHSFSSDKVLHHLNLIAEAYFKAPPRTSAKFLETRCHYPGCKSATSFLDYEAYITHLHRVHKLSSREYPGYLPTAATANPAVVPGPVQPTNADIDPGRRFAHGTQQCQIPDCIVTRVFKDRDAYAQNLQTVH
ncbi:hypothetical protein LTR91_019192 [Friedmanniomyces endolithicus]|uniref:Uncharacterized protein n=1 Tax=Friedmanniomyces endolithicus TaxID=329885 RepID=A0AAN6HE58_9PEZI|nr:hypothetical protein LTS00_014952 [Friedmanniomyces endolithicus]KAK0281561.1 hypothetical protein LTR35_007240 [Friedmanniomyces endolithicus]KAK0308634.1 hypothetical protein LTR82_015446 [Friedmanniomyces endolithicus]KAK0315414.1 hypothetical protein LTR01_000712 [Friedmanniomyces endolithicus]KAK0827091.1 hypothetical protein LTR73_005874 [Friedmanniomyces endolithicus]